MNQEILLALIVSADTFLTSATYRSSDIKIPILSAFVINITGAVVLTLSLLLSEILSRFISPSICSIAGFIILTAIGLVTIFKSIIRTLVRKLSERGCVALKSSATGIIVKLYLDDTSADSDGSQTLSAYEALALALAGSLDSASTGLSCGFNNINPLLAGTLAFVTGFTALALGTLFGKKISTLKHDLSWLGGVFLIAFAVFEFVKSYR
ncbi:MAG: manganese efflux pump [Ruminococcus flavefaciens]|nr:manganese efflux pump [Ruminococcus flavefaciens]MCM1228622.1 manganese efflux pump [Ruminococcus flavefaciens]